MAIAPLLLAVTLKRRGLYGLLCALAVSALSVTTLAAPWLVTGRIGDMVRAYTTTPDRSPRLVVSAYNLWYLLRLGDVHTASSMERPAGFPLSYQALGITLFGAVVAFVVILIWRRQRVPLTVAAALLSLGLFMLLTQIRERYLFPALPFLLLGASGEETGPSLREHSGGRSGRRTGLLWAYGILSLTFFYNLVTIASPVPALWTNLVAPQPDSGLVLALRGIAVLVAAANTATLVGLIAWLAGRVAP